MKVEPEDCERCNSSDYVYWCIEGEWWGPCESEYCGGGCEYAGECPCECHQDVEYG